MQRGRCLAKLAHRADVRSVVQTGLVQGGQEIFGAKLIVGNRVPAAMWGIPVTCVVLLVNSLVGLRYALDLDVNNGKIGLKLALLVVILVLAFINRKKDAVAAWVLPTIASLTVANVLVATIW